VFLRCNHRSAARDIGPDCWKGQAREKIIFKIDFC
jgi:hypothetical protein